MKRKVLVSNAIFFIGLWFSIQLFGNNRVVIDGSISEMEFMDRQDIEEIEFTADCNVTEIPDYAFLGCTSLRKVILPDGLKKIGFQAFSECKSLEEINLPAGLEDIGSNAFAYCTSLDNIKFPDSLKHIGHNAFSFCDSLREVMLPDNIEEIESYAFSDCASLTKVRLPANGSLLGELILNCCNNMKELIEPSPNVPKFDCESCIFDPEDAELYNNCVLKVLDISKDGYNVSKSWHKFNRIVTID